MMPRERTPKQALSFEQAIAQVDAAEPSNHRRLAEALRMPANELVQRDPMQARGHLVRSVESYAAQNGSHLRDTKAAQQHIAAVSVFFSHVFPPCPLVWTRMSLGGRARHHVGAVISRWARCAPCTVAAAAVPAWSKPHGEAMKKHHTPLGRAKRE
jgi:hypothetical protein